MWRFANTALLFVVWFCWLMLANVSKLDTAMKLTLLEFAGFWYCYTSLMYLQLFLYYFLVAIVPPKLPLEYPFHPLCVVQSICICVGYIQYSLLAPIQ